MFYFDDICIHKKFPNEKIVDHTSNLHINSVMFCFDDICVL
jgi:hypothetical protein